MALVTKQYVFHKYVTALTRYRKNTFMYVSTIFFIKASYLDIENKGLTLQGDA